MRFDGGSLPEHPDSLNLVGRDAAQGQMARDMTLFVDDDGRAYHVYSSEENSTLHISELTDDYLAHSGRYARFFVGRFMEAPALFKRGGRYYLMMSGCTGWAPNAARSAVAESVWGPWRELGNPCEGPGAETTYDSQSTFGRRRGGHRPLYLHGRPLEPGRRRRRTLRVAARCGSKERDSASNGATAGAGKSDRTQNQPTAYETNLPT